MRVTPWGKRGFLVTAIVKNDPNKCANYGYLVCDDGSLGRIAEFGTFERRLVSKGAVSRCTLGDDLSNAYIFTRGVADDIGQVSVYLRGRNGTHCVVPAEDAKTFQVWSAYGGTVALVTRPAGVGEARISVLFCGGIQLVEVHAEEAKFVSVCVWAKDIIVYAIGPRVFASSVRGSVYEVISFACERVELRRSERGVEATLYGKHEWMAIIEDHEIRKHDTARHRWRAAGVIAKVISVARDRRISASVFVGPS